MFAFLIGVIASIILDAPLIAVAIANSKDENDDATGSQTAS
jgi:hypothetical protein